MKRDLTALADTQFDLLVCGGGVYGAWTAYDAALRGLKVALVEQNDWANGTSSASSKLIHGGLRYLETFDFKLVKKALKERGMLLKAAPHRVWPLRFGVPVYADSRVSRLKLKAGLWLYDLMARNLGTEAGHRYFGESNFAKKFPAIIRERLKGGFTYFDAQTDDARLVLELVSGAISAGAVCVNQCEFLETNAEGATVKDRLTNERVCVKNRALVHTSGQWLTQQVASNNWVRLSKGVHIILPSLLNGEALLLTAQSDGRVFFMLPWYGLTLVGTTDTDYQGDVENVVVDEADVQYLLGEVNHYLNSQLTKADVIGSYAGLRAMRKSEGGAPSAVSRDWELKSNGSGHFYSVGGKLTSAREDASLIVDAVCQHLGVAVSCATFAKNLPWTPDDFAAWSSKIVLRARTLGVDDESAQWLMRRHGKRASEVLSDIESDATLAQRFVTSLPFIYADLVFCAREEMVVHLDDLLRRRLPLLILAKLEATLVREIAERVAPILGWSESRVTQEVERLPLTKPSGEYSGFSRRVAA